MGPGVPEGRSGRAAVVTPMGVGRKKEVLLMSASCFVHRIPVDILSSIVYPPSCPGIAPHVRGDAGYTVDYCNNLQMRPLYILLLITLKAHLQFIEADGVCCIAVDNRAIGSGELLSTIERCPCSNSEIGAVVG